MKKFFSYNRYKSFIKVNILQLWKSLSYQPSFKPGNQFIGIIFYFKYSLWSNRFFSLGKLILFLYLIVFKILQFFFNSFLQLVFIDEIVDYFFLILCLIYLAFGLSYWYSYFVFFAYNFFLLLISRFALAISARVFINT